MFDSNCPKCGAHDYALFAAALQGCPHCLVSDNATLKARLAEVEASNERLGAIIDSQAVIDDEKSRRLAEAEFDLKSASEAMRRYAHDALRLKEAEATLRKIADHAIESPSQAAYWARSYFAADSAPAVTPFCGPFPEQSEDERTLRYMLAIRCGEPGELYGDDGELQLGGFPYPIDFRRDSVAEIRRKLNARGMAKLAAQLQAADSASACTCDGEYKYDGDCPVHGDPSFASDQPNAARKTVWKPYDVFGVTGRLVYEDTGEDVPDQPGEAAK